MDIPTPTMKPTPSSSPIRDDLLASVVVFLVALPLCMGIAIASGAPPYKAASVGIITGIVGGLIVGFLAGSPLQVSGPAAGLTVIVFELARAHGWAALGIIIFLAGAMQLGAGLLRLGQLFRAVSPAVIHGMLAGIGVLIIASQFHIMVDDLPRDSGLANLLALPEALWKGIMPGEGTSHDVAFRIGLLTIALIVLWKPFAPKSLKLIPATLVAVTVATIVAAMMDLPIKRVAIPDSLLDAVQLPTADLFQTLPSMQTLLIAAGGMAFIASAETLLCATAVDQLHQGPRTRYDRELSAQGVGNMICGLLGALPMTGVIVRSAANVEAGGRTRRSAILHGAWLLLSVVALSFLLRLIPTAALAAILVFTGFKLVSIKAIRTLSKYGKSEVAIYAATLGTIVAVDLLRGVIVGIALSLGKLLYEFSHLSVRLDVQPEKRRTVLYLQGAATFIRLPRLAAALDTVPPNTELHVHFEELTYIDHACLDLLMSWEKQHAATGGRLVVDWESLTAFFQPFGSTNGRGNGHTKGRATFPEKGVPTSELPTSNGSGTPESLAG